MLLKRLQCNIQQNNELNLIVIATDASIVFYKTLLPKNYKKLLTIIEQYTRILILSNIQYDKLVTRTHIEY